MKEQISTIKKKIRGSRGFTLVEALTAILIMLMASSIVVAGIPAARSAYEKVVIASNAEVLLSTTITALRNELGTAAEIANDKDNRGNANEKTLLYLNRQTGVFSKIYTDTEGKQPVVMLQRYIDPDGKPKSNAPEPRQLISKEASTADLYVTYDKVSFDENSGIITKMAASQISMILSMYRDHFDQENFIKNIILDNLLVVDIYSRAKKLDIEPAAKRAVYIISVEKDGDYLPVESVRELYNGGRGDFITAVDERSVIIVKKVSDGYHREDLKKYADEILEVGIKAHKGLVKVAYGNVVNEIKEISRSYKEARMALDVGKIFFEEKDVIAFAKLGIGRIIYQLPVPLCRMFIKEIFSDKSAEDFDAATVTTINKFFENNLNVSETSRQLSIHRNTLVYRLDKLLKTTGLDLRVFDDAITFKIALMVVRYMKYKENNN